MRSVYEAVDWPVVVLLAGLLPVAGAMQNTGAADLIARLLLENVAQGNPFVGLAVVMVTTMMLTDLMNNAATAPPSSIATTRNHASMTRARMQGPCLLRKQRRPCFKGSNGVSSQNGKWQSPQFCN